MTFCIAKVSNDPKVWLLIHFWGNLEVGETRPIDFIESLLEGVESLPVDLIEISLLESVKSIPVYLVKVPFLKVQEAVPINLIKVPFFEVQKSITVYLVKVSCPFAKVRQASKSINLIETFAKVSESIELVEITLRNLYVPRTVGMIVVAVQKRSMRWIFMMSARH